MQVMIENPHKLLPGSFARRKGGGYLLCCIDGKGLHVPKLRRIKREIRSW